MEEKAFNIRVLRHNKTDLLMATSEDLPGLTVHGRSIEELENKLESGVRDLLEASGFTVVSVTIERDEPSATEGFGPPAFIANAALAARHP